MARMRTVPASVLIVSPSTTRCTVTESSPDPVTTTAPPRPAAATRAANPAPLRMARPCEAPELGVGLTPALTAVLAPPETVAPVVARIVVDPSAAPVSDAFDFPGFGRRPSRHLYVVHVRIADALGVVEVLVFAHPAQRPLVDLVDIARPVVARHRIHEPVPACAFCRLRARDSEVCWTSSVRAQARRDEP